MDQKELLHLLTCQGEEEQQLYTRAAAQRNQAIGNGVHLRGLIEISNICRKNCLYCGIRHSNPNVNRYELTDEEILEAARFAWQHNYGSVVLQGGERTDKTYVNRITRLLQEIKRLSNNQLGITLSLGEQDKATYNVGSKQERIVISYVSKHPTLNFTVKSIRQILYTILLPASNASNICRNAATKPEAV